MTKLLKSVKSKDDLYNAFQRAEGLQRVTVLLASATSKKRAAEIILNEGLTVLGATNGEIDLVSNDKSFYVFAHKGYPEEFVKQWPTIPKEIPTDTPLLISDVIHTKKPQFIKDSNNLPPSYEVGKSFFTASGAQSVALLPLMSKKTLLGVLVFTFKEVQQFTQQEKVFMTTLANQLAQTFDRLTAQENLERTNKQLKELDARKDEFISMASHELKTPLTSMRLFLDLLERQLTLSGQQESIHLLYKAQEQAGRLQRLVTDFLDISRIQQGKMQYVKETFFIDQLVKDTVEGIVIPQEVVIKKSMPLRVHGDKFRLYQVLTNFLTNANKYSPKDSSIYVTVENIGDEAVVSVKDFGEGVRKEEQKRIFEKLYQVTNTEKKSYSGLGMGLYISKEIINHHGGTIGVKSRKGKGATFYFTLPLVKDTQ